MKAIPTGPVPSLLRTSPGSRVAWAGLRLVLLLGFGLVLLSASDGWARNPIRSSFFDIYPGALGTQLDDLPSNSSHCGVCHLDFGGGGPRNPYGLSIQVGLNAGLTREQAILAVEAADADGDGFSNLVEITNSLFLNTPTFPGLNESNAATTSNIPLGEIGSYLVPSGSFDVTPPTVTILSPTGGEMIPAGEFFTVLYNASDSSGVAHVNFYLSDDGGTTFKPVGRREAPTGSFSWFVPNLPGSQNRLRVEAVDNAANAGSDDTGTDFTVMGITGGVVPTTLRDVTLPGTQPFESGILEDPGSVCFSCHGSYDPNVEPWATWQGSMMAHAQKDPLFLAALAIAEQDAPSSGDLCLRCHTPGGWQEGRSVDTSGELVNEKDRQSVQCDVCHRLVDFDYQPGTSPLEDQAVLSGIDPLPLQYGNGQFITDPLPTMRGPYGDGQASHGSLESPLHRSSAVCGTCHDVSNPVFVQVGVGDYAPNGFDQEHPDMDLRNMFPIERTYSEWTQSEYATSGVFAPQFAGTKPDGIVSSCQDCHMRDVGGKGCNESGAPNRTDLPLHDFTGGNTFIPDILYDFFPGEVDTIALQAGKQRATEMLQLAATLETFPEPYGLRVRVTNETGHKLPSGYPEGRRIWLHVRAVDGGGTQVFESGAYDGSTGILTHDEDLKIYEIHPGISPSLAPVVGMPAGPSFHFVLNDTVYFDNRIPPRGFTNAAFEAIQSPVVGYSYADSAYWDETEYFLPSNAETAHVALYYQTTSKEYVEFLRDANTTNSAGQDLYDAWVAHGRSTPVLMAQSTVSLEDIGTAVGDRPAAPQLTFHLGPGRPNPFRGETTLTYSIPEPARVRIDVYDLAGRRVRSLQDGVLDPGRYEVLWDGRGDGAELAAAGIYFVKFRAGGRSMVEKIILIR